MGEKYYCAISGMLAKQKRRGIPAQDWGGGMGGKEEFAKGGKKWYTGATAGRNVPSSAGKTL